MRQRTYTIGLAVAILMCGGVFASATTYVVDADGTGDFETIQAAVDAAAPGDTLLILAGDYFENVQCSNKRLKYYGEGQGITRVVAALDAPALEILDTLAVSAFRDMTITAHPSNGWAVYYDTGYVNFHGCELVGTAGGGGVYGAIGLWDCTADVIEIQGGAGSSEISNSSIGSATFTGWVEFDPVGGGSYLYPHPADISASEIENVRLQGALLDCVSTTIGHMRIVGDRSSCDASGVQFGSIDSDSADLRLIGCSVTGPLEIWGQTGAGESLTWDLVVENTLVEGGFSLQYNMIAQQNQCTLHFIHNTIIGDLFTYFEWWHWWSGIYLYRVRGNIVQGYTTLDGEEDWWWFTTVSHNDFVGGFTAFAPPDSIYGNISEEPLFCSAQGGDYSLQDCSPCIGAAHDGGDMGAFGVGCACVSPVRETTWGRIKAMFRQPSN